MKNINVKEFVEQIRLDADWEDFSDEELEEIIESILDDLE